MTHVTTEVDEEPIIKLVHNLGVESIHLLAGEEMYYKDSYIVILNGENQFY